MKIDNKLYAFIFSFFIMSACAPIQDYKTPQENYPIEAVRAQFTIKLPYSEFIRKDISKTNLSLNNFFDDYHRRGKGKIILTVNEIQTKKNINNIKKYMAVYGISKGTIFTRSVLNTSFDTNNKFSLTYEGYIVKVPTCNRQNWDQSIGFNPGNISHKSFGCSFQRNIGLMISDPQDLVKSASNLSNDPSKILKIISQYRSGADTTTKAPVQEKGQFASPSAK